MTVRVIVIAPVMVMALILIDDVPPAAAAVPSFKAAAAAAAPTPSVNKTIMVRSNSFYELNRLSDSISEIFVKDHFHGFHATARYPLDAHNTRADGCPSF